MSVSKEFAALARAATPGIWVRLYDDMITSQVDRVLSKGRYDEDMERYQGCTWQKGARAMNIRIDPDDYDAKNDDQAEKWADADIKFIVYCANNRDRIARALRLDYALEKFCDDPVLIDDLAEKISNLTFAVSKQNIKEIAQVVFAALREAVK